MMAEAQRDDDEIFVYTGGDQDVPQRARRVRIHESIKIIPARAFRYRHRLIYVEFHDEIETIEEDAFSHCISLGGRIQLLGVRIVKKSAFYDCSTLSGVELGDVLETIEEFAFHMCISLRNITMPSVRTIGLQAFGECYKLFDVEFGERLETLGGGAFDECRKLKRIVLPLKDNMIYSGAFDDCPNLATVDLVGGIHNTIASLHMKSWRNEMTDGINRINQVLPSTDEGRKSGAIRRWMPAVIQRLNHYKTEHLKILKEATMLLELTLWKANLDENEGGEKEGVRTTRGSRKRARKEICVTSGASIVIKNVLPFLVLK